MHAYRLALLLLLALTGLTGCGGGSDNAPSPIYAVGGIIEGLDGTLVLRHGGETATYTGDGTFTFATRLRSGDGFNITIVSAPASQSCVVRNGRGVIDGGSYLDIEVECGLRRHQVGGTVSGLNGTVRLQNRQANDLTLTTDGAFTFSSLGIVGVEYDVAVFEQPAGQTCTVNNGKGTSTGADVGDVQVQCVDNTQPWTLGGTISGLAGNGLVLQVNGGNLFTAAADATSFQFSSPLNNGTPWVVSVRTQPLGQACTVSNGSGTLLANVANVSVTCINRTYAVSGEISGLIGEVVLKLTSSTGSETIRRIGNGVFTFSLEVPSQSTYQVDVVSSSDSDGGTAMSCRVNDAVSWTGTVGFANVTGLEVECALRKYSIDLDVSGLDGTLALALNGELRFISADGHYTYTEAITHGSDFTLRVASSPSAQTCSVRHGQGEDVAGDVTDVLVICGFPFSAHVSGPRTLTFSIPEITGRTEYSLYRYHEAPGTPALELVAANLPVPATAPPRVLTHVTEVPVLTFDWEDIRYVARACAGTDCVDSAPLDVQTLEVYAIGYFKAPNTDARDFFGTSVALSRNGQTLAVGSPADDSNATTINPPSNLAENTGHYNNDVAESGAVIVYHNNNGTWERQAFIKAANADEGDLFGISVALSEDGDTLVVGASGEASAGTGSSASATDNSAANAGAVYVFTRDGTGTWQQRDYLKASNGAAEHRFGAQLALSDDGETLVVGAAGETGAVGGINATRNGTLLSNAGAAYVFAGGVDNWSEQAYIKPSHPATGQVFGGAVGLSADGNTLAVGASGDASAGANPADTSTERAGAAYVYTRSAGAWSLAARLKAGTVGADDRFGASLALAPDGSLLVVGAANEDSSDPANPADNGATNAGAAYVFSAASAWAQQAYLKAETPTAFDNFGSRVAIDGDTLALSATSEDSNSPGINSEENDLASGSGAVFVFHWNGSDWGLPDRLKSNNPRFADAFGNALSFALDGSMLAVGAAAEDGSSTDISSTFFVQSNPDSGAVFLY